MAFTDDDLQQWRSLALHASQANWDIGHSNTQTLEEAVAYMTESIAKSDSPDLWMVCFGERDEHDVMHNALTVAYTGNGPTSEANAEYIAACKPANVLSLIDQFQHARAEIRRLSALLELRDLQAKKGTENA